MSGRKSRNKSKRFKSGIFIAGFILTGIVFFFSCSSGLKSPELAAAKVIRIQGEALKIKAGEKSPVKTGDFLAKSEKVETGPSSSLTIQFEDSSKLLVSENSLVVMEELLKSKETGETETAVRVDRGSVESHVKKQKGFKARYRVLTPAMQLAVRGTSFIVSVDGDTGRTRSMVLEGTVMASAAGKEVELPAGYGTSAEVGKPPEAATALPGAPDVTPVKPVENRLPLQLNWTDSGNAEKFRVQLMTGDAYEYLVYDSVFEGSTADLTQLPDNSYMLRVRSIDKNGLEGENAEQIFVLDAHPMPPEAQSPAGNDIITRKKIKFHWEPSTEAESYIFQISSDEDFSTIEKEIKGLKGNIRGVSVKLEPGEYFWRIAGIDKDKKQGPFSTLHKFAVESRD